MSYPLNDLAGVFKKHENIGAGLRVEIGEVRLQKRPAVLYAECWRALVFVLLPLLEVFQKNGRDASFARSRFAGQFQLR